jgi:hypothetical protein
MKYQPCGKQSQGRPLRRLLDCQWDWNRSQGIKPFEIYDDDADDGGGGGGGGGDDMFYC